MPWTDCNCNMDLPDYSKALHETEQVLIQCFSQYNIEEVFLSFNGGKDCTVLLDITLKVLQKLHNDHNIAMKLRTIYMRSSSPFKELEDFINQVEQHYGLKLEVKEGEMKKTLQNIIDCDRRLKACLLGTRRTDPYCQDMEFMQITDPSWPQIMRVSPLLNWSYQEIWSYILKEQVPYCSLYNVGYSSIGSTLNTWPNPSLAYEDCSGGISYHPAWRLQDGTLERAGRGTNKINPQIYRELGTLSP